MNFTIHSNLCLTNSYNIVQVILLFLLTILRKRIAFMAALFRESAKCLAELPGLFFQPLLTFTALILFFAFWVTVILCLATASKYSNFVLKKNRNNNNYIYMTINYRLSWN